MGTGVPGEHERIKAVYDEVLGDAADARWSLENPGNAANFEERTRLISQIAERHPVPHHEPRLLDFGSGGSTTLSTALSSPTRIGLDILFDRLATARTTDVPLVCGDGQALPFTSESFDVIAAVLVFSSVLDDAIRRRIADELTRVLRPGGYVLWYDLRYRNPQNRNLRPLGRRAVQSLFPALQVDFESTTLLPPLSRRLGRWTERVHPVAAAVPPLRSHLIGPLVKPAR